MNNPNNTNNPFGTPDDMVESMIASAIIKSMTQGRKKPNPDAGQRKPSHQEGAKAAKEI